jgi:hypothetical protein
VCFSILSWDIALRDFMSLDFGCSRHFRVSSEASEAGLSYEGFAA